MNAYKTALKFKIDDNKIYKTSLRVKKGKYSISHEAFKACNYFRKEVKQKEYIPDMHMYGIDNNFTKGFLTLKDINAVLCWMFYPHSKFNHTIESARSFLANLNYQEKNTQACEIFDEFIKVIRPHIREEFQKYNYKLNHKTWQFEINEISNKPKDENDKTFEKVNIEAKNIYLKFELFNFFKKNTSLFLKGKQKIQNLISNKYFIGITSVVMLFIIIHLIFAYNISKYPFEEKNKKFTILIAPFKEDCVKDGSLKNVEKIIENSISNMKKKYSIDLIVKFDKNLIKDETTGSTDISFYKRIIDQEKANLIIYGSTREENCSFSKKDEIKIEVLSNDKIFSNIISKTNYILESSTFRPTSFSDFDEGKLLENIELIVLIKSLENLNYKSDELLKYILELKLSPKTNPDLKILLSYTLAFMYNHLGNNYEAILNATYVLENDLNNILHKEDRLALKVFILKKQDCIDEIEASIKENPKNVIFRILKFYYFLIVRDCLSSLPIEQTLKHAVDHNQRTIISLSYAEWHILRGLHEKGIAYINLLTSDDLNLNNSINLNRGRALVGLENYDKALKNLENVFSEDSFLLREVNFYKGICFLKLGKLNKAKTIFNDYLNEKNYMYYSGYNRIEGHIQISNLMLENGYIQEAKTIIEKGISIAETIGVRDALPYEIRIKCNKLLGKKNEIIIDSLKILKINIHPTITRHTGELIPITETDCF